MSRPFAWYNVLQDAAQQRGIDLSSIDDDLTKNRHGSEVASWVDSTLKGPNILTAEELALWRYLEKKPERRRMSNDHVQGTATPLDERGLEDEIRRLELSTKSIQARTSILEDQSSLIRANTSEEDGDSRELDLFNSVISRKQKAEAQHLNYINHEIASDFEERYRLIKEKLDRHSKGTSSIVSEKLKSDDRLLESLDTAAITPDSARLPPKAASAKRNKSLLMALQRITALSVKTHLDRVYLQELDKADSTNGHGQTEDTNHEQIEIQDDLQSLYSEIDDVAALLVDNEHGTKLREAEKRMEIQESKDLAQRAMTILDTLEKMTNSTNRLAHQYELCHAYRTTLDEISRSFQPSSPSPSPSTTATAPQPPRGPKAKDKTSSTDMSSEPSHEKLNALLRHLNISQPSTTTTTNMTTPSDPSNTTPPTPFKTNHDSLTKQTETQLTLLLHTLRSSTTKSQTQLQDIRDSNGTSHANFDAIDRRLRDLDEMISSASGGEGERPRGKGMER